MVFTTRTGATRAGPARFRSGSCACPRSGPRLAALAGSTVKRNILLWGCFRHDPAWQKPPGRLGINLPSLGQKESIGRIVREPPDGLTSRPELARWPGAGVGRSLEQSSAGHGPHPARRHAGTQCRSVAWGRKPALCRADPDGEPASGPPPPGRRGRWLAPAVRAGRGIKSLERR